MRDYLWHHGIDIEQDAVIEAAIRHYKKITGADLDRHTMLKIIVMQFGEELDYIDKILSPAERVKLKQKIHEAS